MAELAIPALVEEPNGDAGLGERLRDEDVVLTERVELQLPRQAHLVFRRARRVVAAGRCAGIEVPVRLEVHGARMLDKPLLAQPGLGDDATAFRAGGDEVELVPRLG